MYKNFLQYGAGNIGRGFMGQIFGEAGYKIQFIDVNMEIMDALNHDKKYPVHIVSPNKMQEVWIRKVSCINGLDMNAVAEAIAAADIMAIAVGVTILPHIIQNLSAGIKKRMQKEDKIPLNILICENLIDADKLLYKMISETLSADEKIYFEENIGLIRTSIGRMVPVMTSEMKKGNPLKILAENYCTLPVDKDAFKGEIPEIKNLYPFSPFEFYIKRKLYCHNMGHALTAYLGYLADYKFIWQAISDIRIKVIVHRAMYESALALSKHFQIPFPDLLEYINDLQMRFGNQALGDTIKRVGRDTKRKLSSSDRFVGIIKLCEEEGVIPMYISIGIAAALLYEDKDDESSMEVRAAYNKNGIDAVLKDLCGLSEKTDTFFMIKKYHEQLQKHADLTCLLEQAEKNQDFISRYENYNLR